MENSVEMVKSVRFEYVINKIIWYVMVLKSNYILEEEEYKSLKTYWYERLKIADIKN